MKLFLASIYKEFLVLLRDRSGLAILFIMPLTLVIIMALLQDGPYKAFQKSQFNLILVDYDKDSVGEVIEKSITDSKLFTVYEKIDGIIATEETAKKAVDQGKFKVGIVIPSGTSKYMKKNANIIVAKTFSTTLVAGNMLYPVLPDSFKIHVFFDPLTLFSFKSTVFSLLEKITSRLVTQTITDAYYSRLQTYFSIQNKIRIEDCKLIDYKEVSPSADFKTDITLNSVQHNVPAWTMFAIFFIFLPLAGGIIKERDDGTYKRLMIMPRSFSTLISGKVMLYTVVGCIQFLLMLMVGIYLLPAMGLPKLVVGHHYVSIVMIVFSIAIAATAYGVLLGTFLSTHQQVVTFGSISVIILAALGGIWVPTYIMSKAMIEVSKLSPLEWGLNAFNEIFLHKGDISKVLPEALKLVIFSIVAFILSFAYYKYKRIK